MKKIIINFLILTISLFALSTVTFAERGAKGLFTGETVEESLVVKKTDSGTAIFKGPELKTEIIQPEVNKQETNKNTRLVKKPVSKKVSAKIATGLSYWVEVIKKNGKIERATAESRIFRSGERIRFNFKSNKDGYLYLLAIGSSGKGAVLFPDSRINNGKNFIAAHAEYKVPFGEKSFVMDATPGEEKILVFFSMSEINDINNYFSPKNRIEAQDTRAVYAFAKEKGSKDILFEEDAVGLGATPASYIVTESGGNNAVIFKEIVVKHK